MTCSNGEDRCDVMQLDRSADAVMAGKQFVGFDVWQALAGVGQGPRARLNAVQLDIAQCRGYGMAWQ